MYLDPWKGVFISLEGGEGSGKTSVAEFLHQELEDAGIACLWVREPGSTGLGERIREILLQREGLSFGAMSELMLYLSARAQNLQENILPALASTKIVICDRYNDSSMAYQAAARGLDIGVVKQLCHLATKGLQPHLTLWFDVDPVIGCARAKKHKNGGDVLDRESLDFHRRVREAYTKFAVEEPTRIVRINAEEPLENVRKECRDMIFNLLIEHIKYKQNVVNKNYENARKRNA